MSLEIPRETLERAHDPATLREEHLQDYILVVSSTVAAMQEGRSLDDNFVEGLAQDRLALADEKFDYPVRNTLPTIQSSLRIVRDIMTIRHLEETKEERLAGVDLRGTGDIALSGAFGLERSHRLWEKGVLRIYDQHASRSMWSVEFDHKVNDLGQARIDHAVETILEAAAEREGPYSRRQAHG